MKSKKSRGGHKPRSKLWFGKEDRGTTPFQEVLGKTYGENPIKRNPFGRRIATIEEIEGIIKRRER